MKKSWLISDFFLIFHSISTLCLCTFSMHYYLHIPFCRQKCPYCKFALTPVFDEFKKKRYIEYLKREIREYFLLSSRGTGDLLENKTEADSSYRQNDKKIKTIYFGWGTPSVLWLDEVKEILRCFPGIDNLDEITFECNPEDITPEYISWLIDLGINRISLGVQSLNNITLEAIHRSNSATIFRALDSIDSLLSSWGTKELLQKFDIDADFMYRQNDKKGKISINIDLILWLPHVQAWEALEDIKTLHKKYPFITHTSVYILEKWLYPKSWKNHTLDDSLIQEEYMDILEYLETIGWNHYELSNWASPGYESIHNQAYWNHSNTRGFWLSAASYYHGVRWMNSESFSWYYRWEIYEREELSLEQIAIEDLMFGLRTEKGFDIENPYVTLHPEKLRGFLGANLITQKDMKIYLTKTWIFLIDYILSELISPP